jgi:formamidopyrimidine-DNA glycosylase
LPEIAEVYLSAQAIKPLIQHHYIIDAYPSQQGRYGGGSLTNENEHAPENYRSFFYDLKHKKECKILDIQTKGKFMYWTFSNNWWLLNSFGMSGAWHPFQDKHPCFIFQHTANMDRIINLEEMVFNDPRHFGTIRFTNDFQDVQDKLSSLGWEPLQMPLADHFQWIVEKLRQTGRPISQMLMDQGVFCGVGNYIKAESLYKARLSPWRPSNKLSETEIETLCQAIIEIVHESISFQGASFIFHKNADGSKGKFSGYFKVYRQKQDPLGNHIIAETTPDKRTTHWCPAIQK